MSFGIYDDFSGQKVFFIAQSYMYEHVGPWVKAHHLYK